MCLMFWIFTFFQPCHQKKNTDLWREEEERQTQLPKIRN